MYTGNMYIERSYNIWGDRKKHIEAQRLPKREGCKGKKLDIRN
jgi:hypothetical protein